jgi:amidase
VNEPLRISDERPALSFDPELTARAVVAEGTTIELETLDARAGALLDREPGRPFRLQRASSPPNPLTGPIAVVHAEPGDTLAVSIDAIELGPLGWTGAFADVGGFAPGAISEASARVCRVSDGTASFAPDLLLPLRPMIGCLGTAPCEARAAEEAGPHGGNMDHPPVGPGATVLLPVAVPGAKLFVGDVHALQGDGELSGFGLETPAVVRLHVELRPDVHVRWPWIETPGKLMICTAAPTFEEARDLAVGEALAALTAQLQLEPADAMAVVSVAGDLRLGAAWGGPEVTLRLELPASLGLRAQ